MIGPRRELLDHTGDWARAREVSDSGCVLVRPDHHVGLARRGVRETIRPPNCAARMKTLLAK